MQLRATVVYLQTLEHCLVQLVRVIRDIMKTQYLFVQVNFLLIIYLACNYTCTTCVTLSTTCSTCLSANFRTLSTSTCPCNAGYFDNGVPICASKLLI
jgi:hypothetical protein